MKNKILIIVYILASLIISFIIFSLLNIDFKWWTTLAISAGFIYTYLKFSKNKKYLHLSRFRLFTGGISMKKSVIFVCSCSCCVLRFCPECKCYTRNSADSGDGQDNLFI